MLFLEKTPSAVEHKAYKAQDHCHKDDMGEIYADGVSAKESYGAMPTTVKGREQTSASWVEQGLKESACKEESRVGDECKQISGGYFVLAIEVIDSAVKVFSWPNPEEPFGCGCRCFVAEIEHGNDDYDKSTYDSLCNLVVFDEF